MKIFHEFAYVSNRLKKEHTDFTKDTAFTVEQRKEFLSRYAEFLEQTYQVPESPQKVVAQQEVDEMLNAFKESIRQTQHENQICFNDMNVESLEYTGEYNRWQLYTDKVEIRNKEIIFHNIQIPPTAAALYYLEQKGAVSEVTIEFWMDEGYAAPIAGGILDTTPGRTIELRDGINDLVKIQFYSNGQCYVRSNETCSYHLKNSYVGDFSFEKRQRVTICFFKDGFSVKLNDVESEKFPMRCDSIPDQLFFGCGMFHLGEWRVRPIEIKYVGNEKETHFFVRQENVVDWNDISFVKRQKKKFLGRKKLPVVLGGYHNRDSLLLLSKKIFINKYNYKKAILTIDSLDPGGIVFINGIKAIRTDSFEKIEFDLYPFLQDGANELNIIVFPRAPEVLYNWHRQQDPYNGWFCQNVTINLYQTAYIHDVTVLPLLVEDNKVICRIAGKTDGKYEGRLSIRKIYPYIEKEEKTIGYFQTDEFGEFCEEYRFEADAWSLETTNLYALKAVIVINGTDVDKTIIETGFRTIKQREGEIFLNGKKIVLTGTLCMQFLPPHEKTTEKHICVDDEEIIWQELMNKKLNGNTLRMHILGYGTNDGRYAQYADRMGQLLIWTTRYLDSLEQVSCNGEWKCGEGYVRQLRERINSPSIIMWEGANEYHPTLKDIDNMYHLFVSKVKQADFSRLICPISHLYYAKDMIPLPGCSYYNDEGTEDEEHNIAHAAKEWSDPQVVRSAHTYEILLGYGTSWKKMRKQDWSMQKELIHSKKHAYLVTEFAVIGRQNPNVPEAKIYFNPYSYELPDDDVLDFRFSSDEWKESQAYQALAAKADIQKLRLEGVDGMLWCCLMGGANDGGYLKPVIDNYGYPKLAFYTMRESFGSLWAASDCVDVLHNEKWKINPVVFGTQKNKLYSLTIKILDMQNKEIKRHMFKMKRGNNGCIRLEEWTPDIQEEGYYELRYELEETEAF